MRWSTRSWPVDVQLFVVKGVAGLVAVAGLFGAGEHYVVEGDLVLTNANVAASHATIDGRAGHGGYVAPPVGERQTVPPLQAVPSSDAATAVIADQTLASTLSTQGEMYIDHGRWLFGAAGALFLLLVRSSWADVRRWLLRRPAATRKAALPDVHVNGPGSEKPPADPTTPPPVDM
jgi:hypothetical protein